MAKKKAKGVVKVSKLSSKSLQEAAELAKSIVFPTSALYDMTFVTLDHKGETKGSDIVGVRPVSAAGSGRMAPTLLGWYVKERGALRKIPVRVDGRDPGSEGERVGKRLSLRARVALKQAKADAGSPEETEGVETTEPADPTAEGFLQVSG